MRWARLKAREEPGPWSGQTGSSWLQKKQTLKLSVDDQIILRYPYTEINLHTVTRSLFKRLGCDVRLIGLCLVVMSYVLVYTVL